ncbi:MAG: ParB/RepB/Spo0J family partition protein, partial [Candidatus Paceibacterota bacterium]
EVEYELIAGERRLLAAKMLGLPTVPVIIRKPVGEQKKLELALIENIQREDLTPIAKARAFARLIDEFGLTQQSLAQRIGKSRESIANTLRLLQLSMEAQKALEEGRINEGHARAILLFSNAEKRRIFLREILARNLSGRESLELAQHYLHLNQKQSLEMRRRNISLDPQDLELKEKLENLLGTPVLIKKKGDQGAIEIKFFSRQDLDKILNKIFPL